MHVKGIIKKTVKWSLFGVSALMLFAMLLFGLAQTGPGKEGIKAMAVKSFSKDREQRIEIGKIDGSRVGNPKFSNGLHQQNLSKPVNRM